MFTQSQHVGENKYCTEFIVEDAVCTVAVLRDELAPRGESLLVIGAPPILKVHIHTDDPEKVKELAGRYGRLTRVKVDNMEQQHNVLVVDKPEGHSIIAVVPGPGFERIARELGAEVTVSGEKNPSVRDLLLAINKTLRDDVYLFVNDKNVALAASEVVKLTDKRVRVVHDARHCRRHRRDCSRLRSAGESIPEQELTAATTRVRRAQVFFAGKGRDTRWRDRCQGQACSEPSTAASRAAASRSSRWPRWSCEPWAPNTAVWWLFTMAARKRKRTRSIWAKR